MGIKEDWENAVERLRKALTDPWELESTVLTGKLEEFIGPDGKLDWDSIKQAAFVDGDASKIKFAGSIHISMLDGDGLAFMPDDPEILGRKEEFKEQLMELVKNGMAVRQQWLDWWAKLAKLVSIPGL